MIFVTADSCRSRLAELTQLLLSAFPGSTVYQHTDLCRAAHDILRNKVDAVFLNAQTLKTHSSDFVQTLRRQKPTLPVFVLSQAETLYEAAAEFDANSCIVYPVTPQQLRDAIQFAKSSPHAS